MVLFDDDDDDDHLYYALWWNETKGHYGKRIEYYGG
jgi:hypothetical protein